MKCYQLLTAISVVSIVAMSATPTFAKSVRTAIMADRELHPHLNIHQEEDEAGQLRYSHIEEFTIPIVPLAYGRCGTNYRVRGAFMSNKYVPFDGGVGSASFEVLPGIWITDFPVNTSKRTFGPHWDEYHIPTGWLTPSLTQMGEEIVAMHAERNGTSLAQERARTFTLPVEIHLAFYMQCRRYAGNKDKNFFKSVRSPFLIIPTFIGKTKAPQSADDLVPVSDPSEQPSQPIPGDGGLAARTRIESTSLLIIPEERETSCRLHLSTTFRTSGPTVVTYQLVDALAARSPKFEVNVDQSGVAFASHEVELGEPDTNTVSFEAFTAGQGDGGPAFGGVLQDQPSDRSRGYYRIETIEPHRTLSNIAGYNLDECKTQDGFPSFVFDAIIFEDSKSDDREQKEDPY